MKLIPVSCRHHLSCNTVRSKVVKPSGGTLQVFFVFCTLRFASNQKIIIKCSESSYRYLASNVLSAYGCNTGPICVGLSFNTIKIVSLFFNCRNVL